MQATLTILGSGTSMGVPTVGCDCAVCASSDPHDKRTRPSVRIEYGGHTVLIDTGTDFRQQALRENITRVDAVLYTHAHADHITGLDDVRILNRIVDRPLDAFSTAATLRDLELRFGYAFLPWQPPGFFRPVLVTHPVEPGQTIVAAGMSVQLFDQDHGFTRSLGLRVGGFGYSTDVVDLDDAAFAALAGIDTWVVGCFQRHAHRTHAWLPRVLTWVERLRPRRTVLTHMGPDMDFGWLTAKLPPGVEPGFDGMALEVEV